MAVKITLRTGTRTQWQTTNPTLAEGEVGIESDTRNMKIGDGINAWNSLKYWLPEPRLNPFLLMGV